MPTILSLIGNLWMWFGQITITIGEDKVTRGLMGSEEPFKIFTLFMLVLEKAGKKTCTWWLWNANHGVCVPRKVDALCVFRKRINVLFLFLILKIVVIWFFFFFFFWNYLLNSNSNYNMEGNNNGGHKFKMVKAVCLY